MTEGLSYDMLLQSYRDLQLRVTRFSATEQALINTRDRLDQELLLYKRLQRYNSLSLIIKEEEELLQLISEAVVDILDVESSVIYFQCMEQPERSRLIVEGFRFESSIESLPEELTDILGSLAPGQHMLNKECLSTYHLLSNFSSGVISTFWEQELGFRITFLGAISCNNELSYRSIDERLVHIFHLLTQQMHSILAKLMSGKKIEQQVETITKTANELKKLSLIATKTKSGVIITDSFGRIEWVNEAFSKISGYTLDEVKGLKPKDFLQSPDTDEDKKKMMSDALKRKEDLETVIVNKTKSGVSYYNQLEIVSVFDEAGNHMNFIAIQKDITDEINYNKEILKINSRFATISDSVRMGIWEWDVEANLFSSNDMFKRISGYSGLDGPYDHVVQKWNQQVHEEDRTTFNSNYQLLFNGEVKSLTQEYRFFRKSDNQMVYLKSTLVAEHNEKGQLVRMIGGMVDITSQKESEKTVLQKNEELSKINAELDHFVYSISHDLRSPLLSIKGLTALVLQSPELTDENKKFLNMTLSSATRLDNTIQEILEYSRNSRLELSMSRFDIADQISNIFDDLKFVAEHPLKLEFEIEGDATIYSDKPRVGVLLKNIIGNSIKYRKPDDNLLVKVKISNVNEMMHIVITDNGEGIAPKHLDKVFNMFYRGTTTSVGTGLGLYICKEIVNKLGGKMSISSEQGIGTSIQLELPNQTL